MTDQEQLEALALAWFNAKASETRFNEIRVSIEADILALAIPKPEGSATTKTPLWKITTTGKMNRKLDIEAFDAIAAQIPADLHPIKITRTLDEKGFDWIKTNRPDLFALISPAVTTTPAKTAVKCEPLSLGAS